MTLRTPRLRIVARLLRNASDPHALDLHRRSVRLGYRIRLKERARRLTPATRRSDHDRQDKEAPA